MNLVLKIAAVIALLWFLGILIVNVPRLDLGVVLAITVLLTLWDFFAPRKS